MHNAFAKAAVFVFLPAADLNAIITIIHDSSCNKQRVRAFITKAEKLQE